MNAKIFQVFTRKGAKYIAIPNGSNWHVLGENGDNFGSWMSVENFLKHLNSGDETIVLGKARLSLQVLS